MKNNLFILCISFLIFGFAVEIKAQQKDEKSIQLKSGVTIVFRSETDPPSSGEQDVSTYEVTGKVNAFQRVFFDVKRAVYFGYQVIVDPVNDSSEFQLTFKPLSTFNYVSISKSTADSSGKATSTGTVVLTPMPLPKYPAPQQVQIGDTVAFDVLINRQTGVKIIDLIKISATGNQQFLNKPVKSNKAIKPDDQKPGIIPLKTTTTIISREPIVPVTQTTSISGSNSADDFTIDAIELKMSSAYLHVNGLKIGGNDMNPPPGIEGSLIWFYLPNHGRFILSLTPRKGYNFQKRGTVSGNKISFAFNGNKYEWISKSPILAIGNRSWNLWVLHDPDYRPSNTSIPEGTYEMGSTIGNLESILKKK